MPLTKLSSDTRARDTLSDWVRSRTGIDWAPERWATFSLRARQALLQLRVDDAEQLLHKISSGLTPSEENSLIDIFTNHETRFFRDLPQFSAIKTTILPDLIKRNSASRQINIWSAACSTGQEPYSLAMMLDASFPELRDWEINILGTDVSLAVLERARSGIYSTMEVGRGLPTRLLIQYFRQAGSNWVLKDSIRKRVRFRQHNLLKPMLTAVPFDLILVRNVLIYFSKSDQERTLQRLARTLSSNGYLLLGTAESVDGAPALRKVHLDQTLAFQPNLLNRKQEK